MSSRSQYPSSAPAAPIAMETRIRITITTGNNIASQPDMWVSDHQSCDLFINANFKGHSLIKDGGQIAQHNGL